MNWPLEPVARRKDRDGSWGDRDADPGPQETQLSTAISLKRIADAVEKIANTWGKGA